MVKDKVDEFSPEVTRKISSDDEPWMTIQLKNLVRKKKREFHKNRRSTKFCYLQKKFKRKVSIEKKKYKS